MWLASADDSWKQNQFKGDYCAYIKSVTFSSWCFHR